MISGAHIIIYSQKPDADRAFLRDVLGLSHVDAGGGWLIFALPPAEMAFHPSDTSTRHEIFLMCEDIEAFVANISAPGIECSGITTEAWGLLSSVTLPGGGVIGVYEPRHERPSAG